ncbi:hypothetical protein TVAG_179830 [Trichomonas vaginalis G3]|uniref:Importin N-terminal domain-containing protein n=1 Tax=Trichomonas vaginalis (strain ATCC PRA-98 / G3) TaxID=412133 RepID=A2F465_TRIV3|nr:armadillo (ARM) repeat-containing protein family [Trichomonas vaginalis G3]EAY00312.1 hypothetical protein TVAG_179830 [Trichomonas vaginalis G3]KAI5490885.1 armadillo (ARM) repeat-containing protein family [Trichomonas vaginalis G3]|eukprot:XP_001313241.1 hypothetical protein [Trichomonas vaginalis G3]
MSEDFQKVINYGQELINNQGIFAKKEILSYTFEEIEQCFNKFKENSDINFTAGFVSSVCDAIISNWQSFSDEQKENIKKLTIEIINSQISAQYALRLSYYASRLYQTLNSEWNEFSNLIFESSSISDTLAFIFIGAFDTFQQEYIQQNKDKITNRIFEFLSKVSIVVQLRLLNLLCCIDNLQLSEEKLSLLWNYIFNIIFVRPSALIVINTILTGIFNDYHTIQQLQKPGFETKENYISSLRLLFTFNPEKTIELLSKLVDDPQQEFVDALNSEFLDTVQPNQMAAISDYIFKEEPLKVKRLTVLTPLIPYLANSNPKFVEKAIEILKITSEDNEQKESFLTILKYGSSALLNAEKMNFVLQTLISLMANDDEIGKRAADVSKAAFKSGLIKTRQDIKFVITKYQTVSPNLQPSLIISLDSLANSEGFDSHLITPLVEFVRTQLRNASTKEEIKASCFTLISSLAEKDENVPFTLQNDLLRNMPELLNGDDQSKQSAAQIIYLLAVLAPDSIKKLPDGAIDTLFGLTRTEGKSSEIRGAIGESLAGIVASCGIKALYPQLVDLIDSFLKTGERNLGISASTMVIIACECFEGRLGQNVMLSCARAAAQTDYAPLFNSFVEGLRRIASTQPVDKWNLDFSLEIVNGFVKVAEIEPISSWYNLRTPLYSYFTIVMQKLGSFASPLIPYLLDIVSDCVDPMVDVVFEPVKRIYELNLIDDETKDKLIDRCCTKLLQAKSFEMLHFAVNNTKDLEKFASIVAEQLRKIDQTEQTENVDDEWMCNLALSLLVLNERGAQIEDDDLETAIVCFPPEPSYKISEDMIKQVIRVSKAELSDDLKMVVSKVIFDFLLLPKQEVAPHGIQNSFVTQLKDSFAKLVKSDKEIENELVRYCGGVKSKVGKLNQLIR